MEKRGRWPVFDSFLRARVASHTQSRTHSPFNAACLRYAPRRFSFSLSLFSSQTQRHWSRTHRCRCSGVARGGDRRPTKIHSRQQQRKTRTAKRWETARGHRPVKRQTHRPTSMRYCGQGTDWLVGRAGGDTATHNALPPRGSKLVWWSGGAAAAAGFLARCRRADHATSERQTPRGVAFIQLYPRAAPNAEIICRAASL